MSPEQDKDRTNDQTDEKTVEDLKGVSGGSAGTAEQEVSRITLPVEPPPAIETPPTEI